jgi:protein-L-isoaspartate(D-aspartate) O-methyltransferase
MGGESANEGFRQAQPRAAAVVAVRGKYGDGVPVAIRCYDGGPKGGARHLEPDGGETTMHARGPQQRLLMATPVGAVCLVGVTAAMAAATLLAKQSEEVYQARRESMVRDQIESRGVKDKAVLAAFRKVPRHRFVPTSSRALAYTDGPLPIGEGQTISQPEIVALMTELIRPDKRFRVLEVGTGSGYQAAILAECVAEVDSVEVVPALGKKAKVLLGELGYRNIELRIGDGYEGWAERAPFDAIILTAAPPREIPRPLLEQLKVGGRLVAPVGRSEQQLVRVTRTATGFEREIIAVVRFVPMTGKAQDDTPP